MPDFRASVIVPVYNVEAFLRGCLESLKEQTIGFEKIEVVLVNDGSTDGSEAICREYAEMYENIFFFSKENEGLSKTRNYALARAHGKYIFFLDSDDRLKANTIEAVTDFFDTVYDEVDLVTYRIIQYYNSKPTIVHYRYRTLTKSGVYDLWDKNNRFIVQTNVNICIKNRREDNVLFDTTKNFKHEDEKFCCDILREKMKIGFCAEGEYIYNRDNINSIVSSGFSPEIIFDTSMNFYERLFDDFGDFVPTYFQAIVFNDLRWKLKDGKLLPTHLEGDEWLKANRRIDKLLQRMDEDTILLHPSVSQHHLFYWLMRRPNSHPIVLNGETLALLLNGRKLYEEKSVRIKAQESKFRLMSPVFFFLNENSVKLFKDGEEIKLSFKKDAKSDDVLCLMPEFESADPEGEYKLLIGAKEYKCKF